MDSSGSFQQLIAKKILFYINVKKSLISGRLFFKKQRLFPFLILNVCFYCLWNKSSIRLKIWPSHCTTSILVLYLVLCLYLNWALFLFLFMHPPSHEHGPNTKRPHVSNSPVILVFIQGLWGGVTQAYAFIYSSVTKNKFKLLLKKSISVLLNKDKGCIVCRLVSGII